MLRTLETRSVVDALYDDIRAAILSGDYGPGEVIAESAMSSRYQVARPTAHTAIERLVATGLLTRNRSRGAAIVARLDRGQIEDLYRTRTMLESAAHVLAAQQEATVNSARKLNLLLTRAADEDDIAGVVSRDVAFHQALVRTTGSERLIRLHALLMTEAHLCMAQVQARHLLDAKQIVGEHAQILSAIESGTEQDIVTITTDHLARARNKLIQSLGGAP
jgi:DNA-binding GntR family transcriptional regulator